MSRRPPFDPTASGSGAVGRRRLLRDGAALGVAALAGCGLPAATDRPRTTATAAMTSTPPGSDVPSTIATTTPGTDANAPPTAAFTASPADGLAPVLVELDATASSDPDGAVASYAWTVGDHAYEDPVVQVPVAGAGPHRVGLTVTDDRGTTDRLEAELTFRLPHRDDYPITGQAPAEYAALEEALLDFLVDRRVTSAVLGVARDGAVGLERGYGWADRELTEPTAPDARFRLGSVTKPIVAAAVRRLVREGALGLDDRVFRELDLEPPAGEPPDDRVFDVTVEHLLDHEGGWDREATFDPVFHDFAIAEALGLTEPPTPREVVRYMLGRPLQFAPGDRSVYSNFGYLVLGVYAEAVTGQAYADHLRGAILEPIGADDVGPGRTRPADRDPREARYFDPAVGPNVVDLDRSDLVHLPDGGFHLEGLQAVGDLVASTRGLLAFLDAFWLTGEPRGEGTGDWVFTGSLPGAFSLAYQRPDGHDVAVLLNRRGRDYHPDLRNLVDAALDV